MKAVTGPRCPARWQWGLRRERKALVWESRERRCPGPLSSPGLAFAQAAAPRSCLGLGLRCRCLTSSASRPGLSTSPRPFLAPPSGPRPPVAIPTLLGHQTLTCEVLDPGHGPLPTVPRSPRQQQQQSEEEKAQEAPGVRARGQGGHAQPRAVRQLWGNSSRLSGRRPSPHLPRPHLPRDQSESPRQQKCLGGGCRGTVSFSESPPGLTSISDTGHSLGLQPRPPICGSPAVPLWPPATYSPTPSHLTHGGPCPLLFARLPPRAQSPNHRPHPAGDFVGSRCPRSKHRSPRPDSPGTFGASHSPPAHRRPKQADRGRGGCLSPSLCSCPPFPWSPSQGTTSLQPPISSHIPSSQPQSRTRRPDSGAEVPSERKK